MIHLSFNMIYNVWWDDYDYLDINKIINDLIRKRTSLYSLHF